MKRTKASDPGGGNPGAQTTHYSLMQADLARMLNQVEGASIEERSTQACLLLQQFAPMLASGDPGTVRGLMGAVNWGRELLTRRRHAQASPLGSQVLPAIDRKLSQVRELLLTYVRVRTGLVPAHKAQAIAARIAGQWGMAFSDEGGPA